MENENSTIDHCFQWSLYCDSKNALKKFNVIIEIILYVNPRHKKKYIYTGYPISE